METACPPPERHSRAHSDRSRRALLRASRLESSGVRVRNRRLFLVLERECELGPVGQNLAVLDLQVHLRDFSDPQVPEGFAGRLDGTFGRILP